MENIIDKIKNDPFAHFLGVNLEEVEKGYARCSLTLKENMLNFLGTPHGGLLFTLADIAFAAASNFDSSPSFALDISGTFFKTAEVGDKLTASARVINSTKKTGHYEMRVYKNEEQIARFNGTVFRKV